jgi:hypothetical protein
LPIAEGLQIKQGVVGSLVFLEDALLGPPDLMAALPEEQEFQDLVQLHHPTGAARILEFHARAVAAAVAAKGD